MSKRSIRKVRHVKPALSFKALVQRGQLKKTMGTAQLTVEEAEAFEQGFGALPPELQQELENATPVEDDQLPALDHVHGEHCNH